MKKLLKRIVTVMLACTMGISLFGGCSNTGKEPGKDPGGTVVPDPKPDPDPAPDRYEYGSDWADSYDAAYTESLLAMGDRDFTLSQIGGTDGAGRAVTPHAMRKKSTKYVGIFYFLWLGTGFGDVYDISKLQEKYADRATDTVTNPLWALSGTDHYDPKQSPQNAFHYFEEPLYGYYNSEDPWVIRKHLEMLSTADIDFLYLDFTNAGLSGTTPINLYQKQTYALMDAILEMQKAGYDVPQIVPIVCNPYTGGGVSTITKTIEWVYNNYYAYENFKYSDCWFRADKTRNPSGNPMLVCYDLDAKYLTNKEIANAFWIRNVVWPTNVSSSDFENGFPWMDYSLPQKNYNGIMNVSVVQHTDGNWSSQAYLARSRNDAQFKYRGRSAMPNQKYAYESDSTEEAAYGANFANQWENVLAHPQDDEVWMTTVTGWNEWVAQKLDVGLGYATFVDTFNVAFSRDIEMMRDGGYADNFFMQLAQYVRDFKFGSTEKSSAAAMWMRTSLDYKNLSDWDKVSAKYVDFTSEVKKRDYPSVANKYRYTDDSARNDIDFVKIANDSEYLYVLVKTKDAVTEYQAGDEGWMNLYLSTGAKGGWENYNFVINRRPENGVTSIEAISGSDGSIQAKTLDAKADYFTQNNFISYRIPLQAIGVTSASEIQLKVCDNIFAVKKTDQNDGVGVYSFGDVNAFYCGGDCAPIGRLNYVYRMGY